MAWYHSHVSKPNFSGNDKIWTVVKRRRGYAGVPLPNGDEAFHYFEPHWDEDRNSSMPFVPSGNPCEPCER